MLRRQGSPNIPLTQANITDQDKVNGLKVTVKI